MDKVVLSSNGHMDKVVFYVMKWQNENISWWDSRLFEIRAVSWFFMDKVMLIGIELS